MFEFASPYFLVFIPIIIYFFVRKRKEPSIIIPGTQVIKSYAMKSKKHLIGKYLIMFALILMIVALGRPQLVKNEKIIKKEGIDIAVVLDLSKSMLAEDFSPNRLEVAKHILSGFVDKRSDDRISLIVFGGDAYTKVPLTFDHSVVKEILGKLTVNDITSNNQTAIGMGLGVALNRLKTSESKSKVVILLTDGINNSGEMSPEGASKIAKELGIKVYTVGIGAHERVVKTFFGTRKIGNTDLDEPLLEYIANETNGKYFRAGDALEFVKIFEEIDKLEKSEIDGRNFYEKEELYTNLLKIALLLLLLGVFFNYKKYIKIP
ncbi:vWA domain-containing protein [Fusobacterium sp. PH5-44]|uniref:vWA domain-containing protein n=1 Tax=unclassified Fusobacterium TaxID=2648384 RepID=UPI003D25AEC0